MKRTLFLLLALSSIGCTKTRFVGHFGEGAFYHVQDHYRVRYLPGRVTQRGLLSPEWNISNFGIENDVPTQARMDDAFWLESGTMGPRNRVIRERVPIHDLRFVHGDGSILFVRSVRLLDETAEPSVLLYEYVRQSMRTGDRAGILGTSTVPPGHLEWRVVDEGPARVDAQRAHHVTIDIDPPPGVMADPRRVTLVGFRPGDHRWRIRSYQWPMLVVVALSAHARNHEAHRAELASFASRLDIAP